jgi:hypothetical protein
MLEFSTEFRDCAMSDFAHKFGPRLFLWISVSLLFGFAGRNQVEAADLPKGSVTSVEAGPQFAVADLDGDLRPDLATVQAGSNIVGGTSYRIQLHLSTVGQQTVQLVGPAGGLRIEARDVNGDDAVDLVLTTAWLGRPVAILLNDGRGSFSRVEPAAFPGAFSDSGTNSVSGTKLATDAVGLPSPSGAGIDARRKLSLSGVPPAELVSLSKTGFAVILSAVSHAGRAPPSVVPHL